MNAIPPEIYASLTHRQRIAATVAAIAREDEGELLNLAETCPRKTYTMADADYLTGMDKLRTLALAVESDMRGATLDFFAAMRCEDAGLIPEPLVVLASIKHAWDTLTAEQGIDRDDMTKAAPPRHHAVTVVLPVAEGRADPDLAESYLDAMRAFLA